MEDIDDLRKNAAKAELASTVDHPALRVAKELSEIGSARRSFENAHAVAAREIWAQIEARNKLFEDLGRPLLSMLENPHIVAAQKVAAEIDARNSLMASTYARVIGNIARQQDLLQTAVAAARSPLYEQIHGIPAAFRERFSLPDVMETQRLASMFSAQQQGSAFSAAMANAVELQAAMDRMRAPWLDVVAAQHSVRGFAELQSMGRALGSLPPFDDQLANVLRSGLGDWRDVVTWRPDIFTDLAAREALYVEHGVDPAVADFTEEAFEETLEIADLRPQPPALVDLYGDPLQPPAADADGSPDLNREAYDWLYRLETQMRSFIDAQMARRFGTDWHKRQLPPAIYELWQEKAKKAREGGGQERTLISFADFGEYVDIICKRDNWREVFQPFFGRQESLRESLQRLYPIRNDTMHSRPITQIDQLFLYAEIRRLGKTFGG